MFYLDCWLDQKYTEHATAGSLLLRDGLLVATCGSVWASDSIGNQYLDEKGSAQ